VEMSQIVRKIVKDFTLNVKGLLKSQQGKLKLLSREKKNTLNSKRTKKSFFKFKME
jgi:hypothetical protein